MDDCEQPTSGLGGEGGGASRSVGDDYAQPISGGHFSLLRQYGPFSSSPVFPLPPPRCHEYDRQSYLVKQIVTIWPAILSPVIPLLRYVLLPPPPPRCQEDDRQYLVKQIVSLKRDNKRLIAELGGMALELKEVRGMRGDRVDGESNCYPGHRR